MKVPFISFCCFRVFLLFHQAYTVFESQVLCVLDTVFNSRSSHILVDNNLSPRCSYVSLKRFFQCYVKRFNHPAFNLLRLKHDSVVQGMEKNTFLQKA